MKLNFLEFLKFGVPTILGVYLLTEAYKSNLNIFCKILLVCLFILLVCIYLHYENGKKYYIFKIFKGYSSPDISGWLAFLKEHTHQRDEEIIIDSLRYYKNQIESKSEINKKFNTNDDFIEALKSSNYYERESAFFMLPDDLQRKLLRKIIEQEYPLQ